MEVRLLRRIGIAIALAVMLAGAVSLISPPRLLSVADGLAGGGIGAQRAASGVAFGTHGQKLDVWRPATRAPSPLPVLVFWYGGGWINGTRGGYAFAGRAFARAGFLVVIPDYRKVPQARFPAFLEDGAEALRWTRDHAAAYGGDPDRIAVSGHSAGAWIAMMLALDRQWLHRHGLADNTIKAAAGLCGPYDFFPFTDRRSRDAMAGAPDPQQTQPVHFVRGDAPPTLLVTAGNDRVVRARNAEQLAARLRAAGGSVERIDYPGLGHEDIAMALSRPFRGKAPVLADVSRFLHRALAANAAPR